MNYEEKYKQALERAKKELNTCGSQDCDAARQIFRFFPELKESEDERIRKCVKYAIDKLFLKEKIVCDVHKDDVIAWLEKQGEQKPADKVEPKFKVKYSGSEYNVLEVKDIAGVTYYGIEDEPNHIDYVQAENCERVGGYSIKENGSPYPTKPAVFSEKKKPTTWSEDDENVLEDIEEAIINYWHGDTQDILLDWLKSLKERYTWKPSDEQMKALHDLNLTGNISYAGQGQVLIELYNDLKKLK